jgi:hypothetical protein
MACLEEASAFNARLSWNRLRRRSDRSGDEALVVLSDGDRAKRLHSDQSRWKALERNAHRPDVQDLIRQEIRNGTIRVVPDLKGGIRIIPTSTEMKTPPPRGCPDAVPPTRSSRSADAWPLPGSAHHGPGSTEPPFPSPHAFVRAAYGR